MGRAGGRVGERVRRRRVCVCVRADLEVVRVLGARRRLWSVIMLSC